MNLLYKIMFLLFACGVFSACSQEEVAVFDDSENGVYFNYDTQEELAKTINFADYILNKPMEIPVKLNLKALGSFSSTPRKVVLSTKALDGYGEAKVVCPEVVFEPDSITKSVTVMVQRPEVRDTMLASVVYLNTEDPGSEFHAGIKGYQEFKIYVNETYSMPDEWAYFGGYYFGEWSAEKQIFLVNMTQDNRFYVSNDYNSFVKWNLDAINQVRKMQQENPQAEQVVDIPFVSDNQYSYQKPWYWGTLQDKYLGEYSSGAFVGICSALGVNSANEYKTFGGNEEQLTSLNKQCVGMMMEQYNIFYMDGWRTGDSYKESFYVPMFKGVAYDLIEPQQWADEQGGSDLIRQYYGEYSPEKYQFMINTWMDYKGDDFVLNQMFPVMNEWGDVHWDSTLGGEEAIKACNKLFREKMADGTYGFSFPIVE
ncbi:MAG: DUF4843 domain-containing protein [Prevotella sp.]